MSENEFKNNISQLNKKEDPVKNFVPGQNSNDLNAMSSQIHGLANMLGVNTNNTTPNQDTDKLKDELSSKLMDGLSKGQNPETIIENLIKDIPDGDQKEKIRQQTTDMLKQAVGDMEKNKSTALDPEKMQQRIQDMLLKVVQQDKSIDEVIQELLDEIPDGDNIDKKKMKSDLVEMMTNAVNAYYQNNQSQQTISNPDQSKISTINSNNTEHPHVKWNVNNTQSENSNCCNNFCNCDQKNEIPNNDLKNITLQIGNQIYKIFQIIKLIDEIKNGNNDYRKLYNFDSFTSFWSFPELNKLDMYIQNISRFFDVLNEYFGSKELFNILTKINKEFGFMMINREEIKSISSLQNNLHNHLATCETINDKLNCLVIFEQFLTHLNQIFNNYHNMIVKL